MTSRQVYRLKAGNLKNLKCITETLPEPAQEEVTIAVRAIGLNFADVFAIWGLYSATPKGSFIPGLEYAGEVLKVGEAVKDLRVGDRVMGVTRFGAYATHLNIDQRYAIPMPAEWNFTQGAGYLVQVLTAYYGLRHLGNLQEGDAVLIHSAAGGVGIQANRIAKTYGAYTIGSVGSTRKVDFLQQQEHYDRVIVRGDDFAERLQESLDGRDLNLVMECIGGKIFEIGYQQMAPMGRMVVYGSARYASPGNRPNYFKLLYQFFTRPKIDPQKMIEQNKAIMGFNLIWLYEKAELMHQILQEVGALGLAPPHIGHEFEFDQLVEAVRLFKSGQTIGKVVVTVAHQN